MASDRFFRPASWRLAALVVTGGLLLGACSDATTLGGEAADRVAVGSPPTWSNGIGQLLERKCAVCHQVPRLASSPAATPADLDLRYEKSFGAIRAAEDIAGPISLGGLRHGLIYSDGSYSRPLTVDIGAMPPDFATPLYADEVAALETWAGGVIAAQAAYTSPELYGTAPLGAADGELLYKRYCQGCHGVYGEGGPVRWPLRGYGAAAGPGFARAIRSVAPRYPMNSWPTLLQLANRCTPEGAPTTCNGTQLDAIAAFLARF